MVNRLDGNRFPIQNPGVGPVACIFAAGVRGVSLSSSLTSGWASCANYAPSSVELLSQRKIRSFNSEVKLWVMEPHVRIVVSNISVR